MSSDTVSVDGAVVRELVTRTESAIAQLQQELAAIVAEAERLEQDVADRGGSLPVAPPPDAGSRDDGGSGTANFPPRPPPAGIGTNAVRANGATGSLGDGGAPGAAPRTTVDQRTTRPDRSPTSGSALPAQTAASTRQRAGGSWITRVGSATAFRTGVVMVVVALFLLWRA